MARRRSRFMMVSLLLLSLIITACGSSGSKPAQSSSSGSSGSSGSSSSSPAAPAPKASGPANFPLLRVAINSEPPGLDIMWQTANITQDIMHHVQEFLFTMDSKLDFKPMLAEKMDISPDGKTFTIHLRKGVLFHNGKELSTDDVIASMDRWVKLSSKAAGVMSTKESMTAKDKYTLEIKFKEPNGAFLSSIAIHNNLLAIYPKEIVEKYKDPAPRGKEITDPADLIGTGPYKVAEWTRDRHIRLVRYDKYVARSEAGDGMAGKRVAYADEIRFITVKDEQTRFNGLLSGEYDVADPLNPAQYPTVKANPQLQPMIIKPGSAPVGVFNKSKGMMFENEKLRQAVHWSIDHGKVMEGTFDDKNFYEVTPGLAGKGWGFWYNEAGADKYNKRNLAKAKQLMQEAGYKGEKIRWITTKDFDYMYRSALVASEQMKEAGFNVELVVSDWSTVVTNRGKKEAYEIFSTGIGFGGDPTATSAFTPGWPGWYDDPENNKNFEALVKTSDPAARKKLFEEQQRLFWEKVPYLKFGEFFGFRAARANVKGLIDTGRFYFWNVWIEKK